MKSAFVLFRLLLVPAVTDYGVGVGGDGLCVCWRCVGSAMDKLRREMRTGKKKNGGKRGKMGTNQVSKK